MQRALPPSMILLFGLLGCPAVDEPTPDCVPNEAAYEANVRPILEETCASCHGPTPDFGAPVSLMEYAPLIEGAEGERTVDRMVALLSDNSMPPEGQPRPDHNQYDTLVGWASCGLAHPDYALGLQADQPVWDAPADPPAGTEPIELTAGDHPVGLDDIDDYQYFAFSNLVGEDRFIRRIEPIIDESRVLHHITVNLISDFRYLYTWAPGTGAIEFPDGGIRIRPDDSYVVGIHYNNGAGVENARDSSGVRMWLGPTEGTEWGMAAPTTWDISVPAGETAEASSTCTPGLDFEILAGMPHMHEIGSELRHVLRRPDGSEESIIDLTGWSFESQFFYEMSTSVRVGDELELTCTFVNDKEHDVHAGEGTTDEMCFNFIFVTPPEASLACD